MLKKVAIIGSGQAGLASAKYAFEHGLKPVIFEKAKYPGGQWLVDNKYKTNIWDNLHCNFTIKVSCYSDHFYPENTSIFPTKQEVHNYLLSYIDRFQLDRCFRLQTHVNNANQLADKKWRIEYTCNKTNARNSEIFDFLIVASGLNSKPRRPYYENEENFNGTLVHSSQFQLNDKNLESKRVLVIGCSHSGVEISSHLVGHASSITNIFRRPYVITRRFIRFKTDQTPSNSFHILPIDIFLNSRGFKAPKSFTAEQKKEYYMKTLSLLNREQTNKLKSDPMLFFDLEKEPLRVAISDNYYGFVKQGKIQAKKASIKRFESDGVLLDDGSFERADVVIFSTGYEPSIDYFDDSIKQIMGYEPNTADYKFQYLLYKNTFHPMLENMSMICQQEGLFLPTAELQGKWSALVFSGKKSLPAKEVMLEEINKIEKKRLLSKRRVQYPYGSQVDLVDEIASEIGILPDFDQLKAKEPDLYRKLWFNTSVPYHFRLDLKQARDCVNEIDELKKKVYKFDDDDEHAEISIAKLAEKFQDENRNYVINNHIFKT